MIPKTTPVISVILMSTSSLRIIPATDIMAIQAKAVMTEYIKMFLKLVSSKDLIRFNNKFLVKNILKDSTCCGDSLSI